MNILKINKIPFFFLLFLLMGTFFTSVGYTKNVVKTKNVRNAQKTVKTTSEGVHNVYTLEAGGRYILQALICTKDGTKKQVRLIIHVPSASQNKENNMQDATLGDNLPTPPNSVSSGIPSMPENSAVIDLNDGLANVGN